MSNTGKQSPLGVNVLGSILSNTGFNINPVAAGYMGVSKTNTDYTFGTIVANTCLRLLTWAINDAYNRGVVTSGTYDNLISIGSSTVPALGNAKPPTYVIYDPSGQWSGEATTGYYLSGNTGQGQSATWLPYTMANANNSVTQWGYMRLHALQAWNEFNWNGIPSSTVTYKDFVSSFMTAKGFIDYTNVGINASKAAPSFLDGVYSNMNDLITGDISGVSLALPAFGQDCITLGKVIDLSKISKFGLPSVLLQTITKYNALTPSLVLALISSGLTNDDINSISNNVAGSVTIEQEQQIYGAFLVIYGKDLLDILVPLNCKTNGITNLADLLDLKKMFPNSYSALTVPIYNTALGPTNSKTYYPIFLNGAANSGISNPAIDSIIGPIIQPGTPEINSSTTEQDQVIPEGFGSYLVNILPKDIAVTAGAFAYSMQQIKNVQYITFEKFAQVTSSLEVTKGLDKVGGTVVPSDIALADQAYTIVGLGTGPDRTYTMSDFYGCMSGLPYLWNDIQTGITNTQTTKLSNIYNQLYLATTWEYATVSVQYTTAAGPLYTVTGITLTEAGGGYGRGSAVAPVITISGGSGATATCTIGTNSSDAGTNGSGTFGRVTSVTLTSAGIATGTIPTVTIESPPIATLAVTAGGAVSTSGTNTTAAYAGWPGMDTVVQSYIDQANTEILAIQQSNNRAADLNKVWSAAGTQLMVEQRSRYIGIPAVPSPTRDTKMNAYPMALMTFTDSVPSLSMNTSPHMSAQTLEAIADMNTTGGQSLIAMTRESRNQQRLQLLGVDLDNNLPGDLDPVKSETLIANGTVGPDDSNNTIDDFTLPGMLLLDYPPGQITAPAPNGYYDPNSGLYNITTCVTDVDEISPITEILSASVTGDAPIRAGARLPCDNGSPIDTGQGYPGSLGGSEYSGLVPEELKLPNISSVVSPSSYSVEEAIAEIIKCNCDCWID